MTEADPLAALKAAHAAIEETKTSSLRRPDELRMSRATIDRLAESIKARFELYPDESKSDGMHLWGVPVVPDDSLPAGTVEARINLRRLTIDELRELLASGYEIAPPNFKSKSITAPGEWPATPEESHP